MRLPEEVIFAGEAVQINIHPDTVGAADFNLVLEQRTRIAGTFYMKGVIGAYSYIRYASRMAVDVSRIGRYCSIAPGASIGDGQHPTDWLSTHPFQWGSKAWVSPEHRQQFDFPKNKARAKKTVIGNDVWIGTNAIIPTGVTIGDGAIIGGGAVVTRDVPPYAIVAGVPARILRYRFPDDVIARLLETRWWNYEHESLYGIPFDDIERCLAELEDRLRKGMLKPISLPLYVLNADGLRELDDRHEVERFQRLLSEPAR